MANPLSTLEWEPCLLEPGHNPELESYVRRERGNIAPGDRYYLHCPWVIRSILQLAYYRGNLTCIELPLANLVGLEVSRDNACRYCYAAGRALLRLHGMSEPQVCELEARLASTQLDSRTAAAIGFARRLSRSQPLISASDLNKVHKAGFSVTERNELAFIVAYMTYANRIGTIAAVPPDELEKAPDLWRYRLFRPLIAFTMSRHRWRGKAIASAPPYEGPGARFLRAFEGSPFAANLTGVLHEAWSSTVLSKRVKALMWAVIATVLDCPHSIAEACRWAEAEGLSTQTVRHALKHLSAPELDAHENLLLPFARETIWYQPAPLQRQAREVRKHLTAEQFVEAMGILGLWNAVCRLQAVAVAEIG